MTKVVKKRNIRQVKKVFSSPFGIYWEKKNYVLLFAGFALLLIGYYLMSYGEWNSTVSLVLSPIILIFTYALIFPASILYRKKEADTKSGEQKIAAGKS